MWREVTGQDDSYRLFVCQDCASCRIDAAAPPAAELYADYYSADDAQRLSGVFDLVWRWKRRARARTILRHAPSPAAVCDVGCERGELLNLLKRAGCRVVGTQMSVAAAEFARRRFGIDVFVGELEDAPFAADRFDVVLMINVLEHLADPERYVAQVAKMLAPGGMFWVEVPNVSSPTARMTGKHWLHHDPPHHLWGFSEEGLRRLLSRHGFAIEQAYRFSWEHGPIGTLQSWLNALTGRKNVIFGIVQNGLSADRGVLRVQVLQVALSAVLLPLAVLVAAFEGVVGQPQVRLLRTRKARDSAPLR